MDEKHGMGTGQTGSQSGFGNRAPGGGPNVPGQGTQGASESGFHPAQDALGDTGTRASDLAHDAYEQGQRMARQVGERYPQVRRYYDRGTETISRQVAEAPLVSLLAVGAAGFALAWMMSGGQTRSRERAPYRATGRRDYPGQRSGKPLIESDRVEGTAVYDRSGNRIGTIKRVMLEKMSGRVAYAVMSFGGFFGIGADEYAVPWGMLDYDTNLEGYRTNLTAEQLRNAPTFSREKGHDWSDRNRERELHDYYRVSYYWLLG
jgi:sporulation protein YlmC with PRC-barrel domain